VSTELLLMLSLRGTVKPIMSSRDVLPVHATATGSPATTDFGTVSVTLGAAGRAAGFAAGGGAAGLGDAAASWPAERSASRNCAASPAP
jgi:hypothetical protein